MNTIEGGVAAPSGFTASGVAAAIKLNTTKRDCALIFSECPASVAGTFTQNLMKSPPVYWNLDICAKGHARAVFLNSGNANAVTGEQGYEDVRTTVDRVAERLSIAAEEVCICSTGIIGLPLPMDRILNGVDETAQSLSKEGGLAAAEAIMTTDTVAKEIAVEVKCSTGTIRIGAISKGSGMIAPNMATMICILTTDAAIDHEALQNIVRGSVASTFNSITIDNDMSTSDTVLCLANGESGVQISEDAAADYAAFQEAFQYVCEHMAKELVKDGEGTTKLVEISVEQAPSDDAARTVARTIADSMLCKTAFFGEDANWGRIACAAGYAGVTFNPTDLSIWFDDVQLLTNGMPSGYREEDAAAVMKQDSFTVRVVLGAGLGSAVFWTSDLSRDYVTINADYRT
jgi:glutamate N-acetyltransferase/amino-acid N-acetyltransferase